MSKVSVIIPVYNDEAHIGRSVESVCAQTIASELEIIIVDDGSSDDSVATARDVLERHSMLKQAKLISLGENRGVANARKVAIEAAKGDFIMFCDSDDWMETDMCEILLNKALSEDCDAVVCDYFKEKDGETEIIDCDFKDDFMKALLLHSITGSLWNKLIRTDLLKNDRFKFPKNDFSEDFAYCVQLAIYATKIGYVQKPLYHYLHRSGSIVRSKLSGRQEKRCHDDLENFKMWYDILNDNSLVDKFREEIIVHKWKQKNCYRNNLKLWRSMFPELNSEIFKSHYITMHSRIAYFATLVGLYKGI